MAEGNPLKSLRKIVLKQSSGTEDNEATELTIGEGLVLNVDALNVKKEILLNNNSYTTAPTTEGTGPTVDLTPTPPGDSGTDSGGGGADATQAVNFGNYKVNIGVPGSDSTRDNTGEDYILLFSHEEADAEPNKSVEHFIHGTITGVRGGANKNNRKIVIEVTASTAYTETYGTLINKGVTNSNCRLKTITYNDKAFLAVSIPQGGSVDTWKFTGQITNDSNRDNLSIVKGDHPFLSGVKDFEAADIDVEGGMKMSGLGVLNKGEPQQETLTLTGGAAGEGGEISVKNSKGRESLKLDGGDGDDDGGGLSVKNSTGDETFGVAGGNSGGTASTNIKGDLAMKNADGVDTLNITGGGTGQGGELSVKNSTGNEKLKLDGGDGANDGGDFVIKNNTGVETFKVAGGDNGGGGTQTMKNADGEDTFVQSSGGSGEGGTQTLKNAKGQETHSLKGGDLLLDGNGDPVLDGNGNTISGGSNQTFKNSTGQVTLEQTGGGVELDGSGDPVIDPATGEPVGGGSTQKLKNAGGTDTIVQIGGGEDEGGTQQLKNAGGTDTIVQSGGATGEGGTQQLKNAGGTDTIVQTGGGTGEGGTQQLKNAGGTDTLVQSGGATGQGSSQTMKNADGEDTLVQSGGGSGEGSNQTFKTDTGVEAIKIEAKTSGGDTTGGGITVKDDDGNDTVKLEGGGTGTGGGLSIKDSSGSDKVTMDGETGGMNVAGNATIAQTTTETVFVNNTIELTSGATANAPEFSPTGAGAVGPILMYYCKYSNYFFAATQVGQLTRSLDGRTWETCRCVNVGTGAFMQIYSTRLTTGTTRLIALMHQVALYQGKLQHFQIYSDDLGDTWSAGHYIGLANYNAGGSANINYSHEYGVDDDINNPNAFLVGLYNYGMGRPLTSSGDNGKYWADVTANGQSGADLRTLKRWILGLWVFMDQQIDGDDFGTQNTTTDRYFGGTASTSAARALLSTAELDLVKFHIPQWMTELSEANLGTYSANHYRTPGYSNYSRYVTYNHAEDILIMYGGSSPGSSTDTVIIFGIRAMHRHKKSGGTIDSTFIAAQTNPPGMIWWNYWGMGYRNGGYNQRIIGYHQRFGSADNNSISNTHGALFQSAGGTWIPKKYYSTDSGQALLAQGDSFGELFDDDGTVIEDGDSYTYVGAMLGSLIFGHTQYPRGNAYLNPSDPEKLIMSRFEFGSTWEIDTSQLEAWFDSTDRPNYDLSAHINKKFELAEVDGVADVDVWDESTNINETSRNDLYLYMPHPDMSFMIGIGSNGAATRKDLTNTYTTLGSVWNNTFNNGLKVPTFDKLFNHAEVGKTQATFPQVYTQLSINDLQVDADEQWDAGVYNPSSMRSIDLSGTKDVLYINDQTRTLFIYGVYGDRSAFLFPRDTGWSRWDVQRNSGGTTDNSRSFATGNQYSTDITKSKLNAGRVFPQWRVDYHSGPKIVQRSDGLMYTAVGARSYGYTQSNAYPANRYIGCMQLTDPTTNSNLQLVAHQAYSTEIVGRMFTQGWYTWDYDGTFSLENDYVNSKWTSLSPTVDGHHIHCWIQPDGTHQTDTTARSNLWANNSMTSRIDGTWHPDSGEDIVMSVYGSGGESFHDSSLWKYELWAYKEVTSSGSISNNRPVKRVKILDIDTSSACLVESASTYATRTSTTANTTTGLAWITIDTSTLLGSDDWDTWWAANTPADDGNGINVQLDYIQDTAQPGALKQYCIGIHIVNQSDTSKYKVKWVTVRTGSSAWPDEPLAWQVSKDTFNNNGSSYTPSDMRAVGLYRQNGGTRAYQMPHGHLLAVQRTDGNGNLDSTHRKFTHIPLSVWDNWDYTTDAGTTTFVAAMTAAAVSNTQTFQDIQDAGRGYGLTTNNPTDTVVRYPLYPAAGGMLRRSKGALWWSTTTPNHSGTTEQNGFNFLHNSDLNMLWMFVDNSSGEIHMKKLLMPTGFFDNITKSLYTNLHFRELQQNQTLYCFNLVTGRGWFCDAPSATTMKASTQHAPTWYEILPQETGLAAPADIIYSVSLQKYLLVGESGLYVTSESGTGAWESKLLPQYSFAAKKDTGMFKDTDHDLHLVHNGAKKVSLKSDSTDFLIESNFNTDVNVVGSLDISGGVVMPRLTTSQRTGATGVVNGQMVYDTDDNTFYGYANGSWTALN